MSNLLQKIDYDFRKKIKRLAEVVRRLRKKLWKLEDRVTELEREKMDGPSWQQESVTPTVDKVPVTMVTNKDVTYIPSWDGSNQCCGCGVKWTRRWSCGCRSLWLVTTTSLNIYVHSYSRTRNWCPEPGRKNGQSNAWTVSNPSLTRSFSRSWTF